MKHRHIFVLNILFCISSSSSMLTCPNVSGYIERIAILLLFKCTCWRRRRLTLGWSVRDRRVRARRQRTMLRTITNQINMISSELLKQITWNFVGHLRLWCMCLKRTVFKNSNYKGTKQRKTTKITFYPVSSRFRGLLTWNLICKLLLRRKSLPRTVLSRGGWFRGPKLSGQ